MEKIIFTLIGIWLFLEAHDAWTQYMGLKDERRYREDYFKKYGRKLKRKQ